MLLDVMSLQLLRGGWFNSNGTPSASLVFHSRDYDMGG